MDILTVNWWLLYGLIAWISYILIERSKLMMIINPKSLPLPPGPFPLPLVGNIFSLGLFKQQLLHKSFTKLAEKYGPVMSLRIGFRTTIVISSASMAKEVLQTNDVSFANRTVPDALAALQEFSVGLRPPDARWKMYRKICIRNVFSNLKLDATRGLRMNKVQELLAYVQTSCESGEKVNISEAVFTTSLNLLSNTIFSIDLGDSSSAIAREYRKLSEKFVLELGTPNFSDFFPVFKAIDPQGIRKRTTAVIEKMIKLFDTLIYQRLEAKKSTLLNVDGSAHKNNDVLDALLSLANETGDQFQLTDVQHLLFDLFLAGTDTISSSVEWAMAELLYNPEKLNKAQLELEQLIGIGKVLDEEGDTAQLPYLQAVVKETLRMHPPAPFLIARKALDNIALRGFTIPKNAQVLVNVHAIGRDPNLWSNPFSFEPERFLGSTIDFKGQNFELIPFGSGRRICLGLPLAIRMFYLMLGSLIHSFNWKLQDGVTTTTLNMDEKFGITVHKLEPLYLIPLPR